MILNKIIYYNTNFWKNIIKCYAFSFVYRQKRRHNKIKRINKLKYLMRRNNISVIFTRRLRKNNIKKKIKKKKYKYNVLKSKQYKNILFKMEKRKKINMYSRYKKRK